MTEYKIPMVGGMVDLAEIADDIADGNNDSRAGHTPVFDNNQIFNALWNHILEEAKKAAKAQQKIFGSNEYAVGQPWSSHAERFACDQVIEAIQALKEPTT